MIGTAVPAPLCRARHLGDAHRTVTRPRRPLWLWWHLLSLDAPTVAVLWAHMFAQVAHLPLSVADDVVLAGAVWLTYTADRVLDGYREADPGRLRARHRFARRQRASLAAAWLLVLLVTGATGLFAIDRVLLDAGLGMFGIVVLYLCAVHLMPNRFMPDWIKRSLVATIFSVGTALPAGVQTGHPEQLGPPAVAFAALCFLNCTAIATWERADARQHRTFRIGVAACTCMLAGLSASAVFPASRLVFLACAFSTLALTLVDATRDRLSADAVRVLADAALLTAAAALDTRESRGMNCDRIAPLYVVGERLIFGHALDRCRTAHLSSLGPHEAALVCGDGDGRFLQALVRSHAAMMVDYVDVSERMTALARRRISSRFRSRRAACRIFLRRHPRGGIVPALRSDCHPLLPRLLR